MCQDCSFGKVVFSTIIFLAIVIPVVIQLPKILVPTVEQSFNNALTECNQFNGQERETCKASVNQFYSEKIKIDAELEQSKMEIFKERLNANRRMREQYNSGIIIYRGEQE